MLFQEYSVKWLEITRYIILGVFFRKSIFIHLMMHKRIKANSIPTNNV